MATDLQRVSSVMPRRRMRILAATASHVCAALSGRDAGGFLGSVSVDADAIGSKDERRPKQPLYALPPIPLTPDIDLPSATSPDLTPEEVEQFKTLGVRLSTPYVRLSIYQSVRILVIFLSNKYLAENFLTAGTRVSSFLFLFSSSSSGV